MLGALGYIHAPTPAVVPDRGLGCTGPLSPTQLSPSPTARGGPSVLPFGHLPAPSLGPLPRRVQPGSGETMPRRVPVVDTAPLCTYGPCRDIPMDVVRGVGKSGKESGG